MTIAIFGLSANPPHKGHLKVAEAVHDLGYERVVWMLTPQNPIKRTFATSFSDRMELARLLIGRRTWLELSDAEAWMQIYGEELRTHTMLTHLKEIYPGTAFTFVLGSDNWLHFHQWGKFKDILDLAALLVIPRPGSSRLEHVAAAQILAARQDKKRDGIVTPGRWRILGDIPGGNASASQIRRALAQKQATPWLTPQQLDYIKARTLYTQAE